MNTKNLNTLFDSKQYLSVSQKDLISDLTYKLVKKIDQTPNGVTFYLNPSPNNRKKRYIQLVCFKEARMMYKIKGWSSLKDKNRLHLKKL